MSTWLVHYDEPPFADGIGIVAAIECERQGFETYIENPCEPKKRAFVYTPVWKLLAFLPVESSWNAPVVALFILALFTALFAIPPPEDLRGFVLMTLALLSPATISVVQYGNNEMLIFGVAVLGTWFLRGRWPLRCGAYTLFLLAALLKYFPAVLIVSALRERPVRLLGWAVISLVLAGTFVILSGQQLRLSLTNIYTMSSSSYVFGLKNIGQFIIELGMIDHNGALVVRVALTAIFFTLASLLARKSYIREAIDRVDAPRRTFLLVGGLLTISAWLATQNVDYRQIHMILALPALVAIARQDDLPKRLRQLPLLVVALMYAFLFKYRTRMLFEQNEEMWTFISVIGIVLREIGWFAVMVGVAALVLAVLRDLITIQLEPAST